MASTASPYGLRPSKKLGDGYNNHGIELIPIASGYATAIFQGDLVKIVAAGTCEKDTGTTSATPVGVFMGVAYTDSDMGFVTKNNWVASTVASDAMAYVVTDPDMLFEIQADDTIARAGVGANYAIVQGSGNASTGVSGVSLDASTAATTATLPLRVVGIVDKVGFSVAGDAYTDVLVRINTHFNRTATGV